MRRIEPGTFGSRVHMRRMEKGITQRVLASRVGVDFTYISKIEHNTLVSPPSEETIRRIAQELEEDAYEYLRLAGQLPPELKRIIEMNPQMRELFRLLETYQLSVPAWGRILEVVRLECFAAHRGGTV